MKTLGFIGMGNMAGAIAAGIIQKGLMKKDEVFAYAPHYDKLVKNAEKIGFTACKELKELVAKTDTLIMACKPYQIEDVLSEIKEDLKGKAEHSRESLDRMREYSFSIYYAKYTVYGRRRSSFI